MTDRPLLLLLHMVRPSLRIFFFFSTWRSRLCTYSNPSCRLQLTFSTPQIAIMLSSTFALANAVLFTLAQAIPYDQYILAPSSRTLKPISVYNVNGTVTGADFVTEGKTGSLSFQGESAVTFDYAKNIAGIVTLNVSSVSDASQFVGLTFSESSLWISGLYSDATADAGRDEIYWFHITAPGVYTVDADHGRGGFKYLSLVHNSTGSVELTGVSTYFNAEPHKADDELRNYTGYFHSNGKYFSFLRHADF